MQNNNFCSFLLVRCELKKSDAEKNQRIPEINHTSNHISSRNYIAMALEIQRSHATSGFFSRRSASIYGKTEASMKKLLVVVTALLLPGVCAAAQAAGWNSDIDADIKRNDFNHISVVAA